MKTREKEERQDFGKQSKDWTFDVPLESGEKLLYRECSPHLKPSRSGTALVLFLFLGFPFYSTAIGALIGSIFAGLTPTELSETLSSQCVGVVLAYAFCFVSANGINNFFARVLPTSTHLIITDRRIFHLSLMPNRMNSHFETVEPSVYYETRFIDTKFVSLESTGKSSYLQFKLIPLPNMELSDITKTYMTPNAKAAFAKLPLELRSEKGPNSKVGKVEKAKEKRYKFISAIVFIVMASLIGLMGTTIVIQETGLNNLRKSRDAYLNHDYKKAEQFGVRAHDCFSKMEMHQFFGPSCYRLALAYVANGRPEAAIPLFKKAAERCDWEDWDDDVTWRPAVFRSYAHLGDIYAKKNDKMQAQVFYEMAAERVLKESNPEQVSHMTAQYSAYLMKIGKHKRAHEIERIGTLFQPVKQHNKTFRE